MTAAPAPAAPHRDDARADLVRLLAALVRIALVAEADGTAGWRADALEAQRRVRDAAGAVATLHLDDLWALAVKTAERDPAVRRDETVNPTLPTMSPLRLDQIGADPFDLDAAVQAIRDVASFG